MENTLYWQLFSYGQPTQPSFQLGSGEDFCTMGCHKTYASGINLHKFPKEMKDSETAVSVNVIVICAM